MVVDLSQSCHACRTPGKSHIPIAGCCTAIQLNHVPAEAWLSDPAIGRTSGRFIGWLATTLQFSFMNRIVEFDLSHQALF